MPISLLQGERPLLVATGSQDEILYARFAPWGEANSMWVNPTFLCKEPIPIYSRADLITIGSMVKYSGSYFRNLCEHLILPLLAPPSQSHKFTQTSEPNPDVEIIEAEPPSIANRPKRLRGRPRRYPDSTSHLITQVHKNSLEEERNSL